MTPTYSHHPTLTPDGTLHVNNSSLRYVAECDLKAVLHSLRLTSGEENIKMVVGSAIHTGFEPFFRAEGVDRALEAFDFVYKDFADQTVDPNGDLAAYTYDNVRYILETWFSRYVLDDDRVLRIASNGNPVLKVIPSMVEIPFSVPLSDDGIILRGKIDAGTEEMSGHFRVTDHKSTGRMYNTIQGFTWSTQMSLYTWATREHLAAVDPDIHVNGAYGNVIEISKLPEDMDRKCSVHKVKYAECKPNHVRAEIVPVEPSEQRITKARKTGIRLARRYRELMLLYPTVDALAAKGDRIDVQGEYGDACRYCFARKFCHENDRPWKKLAGMFTRVEDEDDGNPPADGAIDRPATGAA
jgi:PD-(D/E)XK nuclease superfamily